jgi:hypothetical protein
MQHSSVNHDALVVEVAHEACHLEIKNFQSAVLTTRKKPLVIFLKAQRSDISSVAFEGDFTTRLSIGYSIDRYFVYLDNIVSSDSQIPPIC